MRNYARSLFVHAFVVTLVILFGGAVHRVMPATGRYHEALVLPTSLPVPVRRPVAVPAELTQAAPTRLATDAPSTLHATTPADDGRPRTVALDSPATIELPTSTVRVSAAPSVTVGVFGSTAATVSGFGANSGAHVVPAGFDVTPAPAAVSTAVRESTQPPVVTYEQQPAYTETARAAHISGVVVLWVRFGAAGGVTVLGVTQGLGYGLNENAILVAESIRYMPAMRGARPVDFETAVHITYQLSE